MNHFSLLCCVALAAIGKLSCLESLNTLEELQQTGFGRPPPRHGLALLQWYVNSCLDNNMGAICSPPNGEYGFHRFRNIGPFRPLPKLKDQTSYAYYTLGNLHYKHSEDLPDEVKRYYDKHNPESNSDRVLVMYNKNKNQIEQIYISEHYKKSRTFIIGPSLVEDLRHSKFAEVDQNHV